MGCSGNGGSFSSCLLLSRATVFNSGCPKLQHLFSFFPSKFKSTIIKNTIFCSKDNASPPSLSSRSYDPFRRRQPIGLTSEETLRYWVEADDQSLASQDRFTVVSYNVLGDRNASKHRDMYPNVPSLYMTWNYRKRVICDELIEWNPDVICLQEVDRYFDLLYIMDKVGYAGSYKRRSGDNVDGCAIFWKADVFRLLEEESIEFMRHGLRDNVAQLSVFEIYNAESRRLVVGNIHVIYNPRLGDVKLGQIRLLLSRAQILAKKWGNIPIVLAGDFNSTPQSAIYNFLFSSQLNIMLYKRKELSGQRNCRPAQIFGAEKEMSHLSVMDRLFDNGWTDEEIRVATGNSKSSVALHPLKLNSSYAAVKGPSRTRHSNGEPLATSYHSKFLGTVDYLWYTDGVVPTRVLDTLPLDNLRRTGGLPCKKLGSDHLALVSEFAFTLGINKGNPTITSAI